MNVHTNSAQGESIALLLLQMAINNQARDVFVAFDFEGGNFSGLGVILRLKNACAKEAEGE